MSILPFKVKAVFEYTSPHEDDLHFANGQIITVTDEEDADWYSGEYVDSAGVKQEGIFPRNFVEKYEPTAPPRPNRAVRPKKEVEPLPATASEPPSAPVAKAEPAKVEAQKPKLREVSDAAPSQPEPPPPAAAKPVVSPPPAVQPKPVQTSPKLGGPPPVSEKPGGSFKDRIAAFNKSAAPPPTPFKPGGLSQGGSSFIKKPFVAPPPSKDAYIPPPREQAPAKIYRRDEDPEIAERETENQENAERAGLIPTANEGDGEDQPKPTSLKERIALLQKQQLEQAARHADAAQKKEKLKRPAKKRTDSHGTNDGHEDAEGSILERQESHDTVGRKSLDSTREEPTPARTIPRHKNSRGPAALPPILARESFGDGNDADMSGAGDETEEPEELSTGRDDSDEKPRARAPVLPMQQQSIHMNDPVAEEDDDGGKIQGETGVANDDEEEEEEEEEEDDVDPEVRRKEEIRARMAKMSGGMGMMGMLGPQAGMPLPSSAPAFKKKKPTEKVLTDDHGAEEPSSSAARAPPVPMALPGMSRVRSPVEANDHEDEINPHEDVPTVPPRTSQEAYPTESNRPTPARAPSGRPLPHSTQSSEILAAPPIPGGRPAPPPIPTDARPTPAAPIISASDGSESDDEMSLHDSMQPVKTPTAGPPARELPARPPGLPPRQTDGTGAPRSPDSKRTSYFGAEDSPTSPTTPGLATKRVARPPPIPGYAPATGPTQTRAPPPPPPGQTLSRSSTGDVRSLPSPKYAMQDESEEEITEYEGDYDTDIASAVPHKDALTAHANYSSENDGPAGRSPVTSSPPPLPFVAAPRVVPPLPPVAAPRAVPPPPPPSQPALNRLSTDMRAAPPPPPREQRYDQDEDDDEYDPYRYTSPKQGIPVGGVAIGRVPTAPSQTYDDDFYSASPPKAQPPPPQERAAPPPPPREAALPPVSRVPPPRQSTEIQKQAAVRRSTEPSRMSMDSGFVANDIDLAQSSMWWKKPDGIPPVFEGRKDILHESEESTNTKRGGKSTTTKDLYILFQDYSQTIIHVRFDPQNPSDAALEQRHEQPPSKPRQDQLEESYEKFGRKMLDAAAGKKDTVVGDGTPQSLVTELLKPFNDALLPIGSRAYGALVYANMANASTSQFDEIRPGDIITLRNAKLQGKHGAMHAKYSIDVGAGNGHVGVVAEWDGTKKKVRVWEQGRDSKKVRLESYKLDDLRSGEVKIWRVMPRSWVGWEGDN